MANEKVFWVWGQHEPLLPARPVGVVATSLTGAFMKYAESEDFVGARTLRALDPRTGETCVQVVRAERVVRLEDPHA